MTPRPLPSEFADIRQSRKVATVAAALELEESQVRRLVETGQLEAHGIGKRGLRIYLDSVAEYQARTARKALGIPEAGGRRAARQDRARTSGAAHKAAMDQLRRDGLLP